MLLDAHHPMLPSLLIDDVEGGLLATRHLIELGHERIAFVGDRSDPGFGFVAGDRRREGYRRALAEAALPADPELERMGPHGRLVAHRLTRELLSLEEPPTAIFAASDTQALGVLEAAGYEGVEVPGELSVVGFDDGRLGIERLVGALLDGDPGPREERVALELVVRRTTGPRG